MSVLTMSGQIPKTYYITVHGKYDDTIQINNIEAKPNLPEPKLIDGSVCYDGECLLTDVKSMKISQITYYPNKSKSDLPKYKITRVHVYNRFTGEWRWINVITQPRLQAEQDILNNKPKQYPFPSKIESTKAKLIEEDK